MQTITSTDAVHVHADMHELNRIRQTLTASQLALWGDHSSKIASMLGLANNHIADIVLNDCGLVAWAIEFPELGASIALGLTAVWSQLANLNALCDLVESKYQVGELTIDRKIGLEHQLLEFAATAPYWAKLGLLPKTPAGTGSSGAGGLGSAPGSGKGKSPSPIITPPTTCLPPVPADKPAPITVPNPIHQPFAGGAGEGNSSSPEGHAKSGGGHAGSSGSSQIQTNLLNAEKHARHALTINSAGMTVFHPELQDSQQLQSASGYKSNSAQN